jgi:DNA-binding NtrC family response regulator
MTETCIIAAHDPWFIQLLRMYVEECGFTVVHAYESQDILPLIHKGKPAVVIMQADLPGRIAGWDALYLIKADPVASHIPFLIFAWRSYGLRQLHNNTVEGTVTLLVEPVTFDSFKEALQKAGVKFPKEIRDTKIV